MIALLLQFWLALVGLVMAALGIWKVYAMGKADQKAKQVAEETKARDVKDQVQNDIGALPADQARKELKTWDPAKR